MKSAIASDTIARAIVLLTRLVVDGELTMISGKRASGAER